MIGAMRYRDAKRLQSMIAALENGQTPERADLAEARRIIDRELAILQERSERYVRHWQRQRVIG